MTVYEAILLMIGFAIL
ncbi:putative holin-like toxin [Veillonella ratti]